MMDAWSGILAEARDDRTVFIAAGLVVAAALLRGAAATERRRFLGSVFTFGVHLVLVVAAGTMRAAGAASYREVRLPCLIFAAMSVIGMAGLVFFAVLLPRVRLRTPRILRDVIVALASVIAVFVLARRAGFNLSGLIATSAVLTAVIGFSLQDTLGNVVGGLALQLDNSIQVGDWVKTGEVTGRVADIRWRYTAIETRNWETVIVPNSVLMKGQVTVLGRRAGELSKWRRWVYFNVDFRYEPPDVIAVVDDALKKAIEHVADAPAPNCILMDLNESYGRYAVRYWLTDLAADDPTDSIVRTRVYFALKRAGIPLSIPAHAIFMTEDSTERREAKIRADRAHRLAALAHIDLFSNLGDEDRALLADGLHFAPFTRGETLTQQGSEAHWLYAITRGEVSVRVAVDGGLEREVARLCAGTFFGEMSLMTGAPRSATVVALSEVECYRLDKGTFETIVKKRPELAEDVAEILARRRVELVAVKEGLDQEAKKLRLAAAKSDLLGKMRAFFGLAEDGRRAVS